MSYSPKSRFQVAILSLVLLSIPFVNSGCAKAPTVNQVLTNVVAKSFMVNSDEWVGVTATFNTAGFMLASINVPVTDPNNLSITYGQFSLIPFLCSGACQGGGNISISVNLTQLAHVQGQPAILPNGTALPIAGFNPALMVALPIGNTSSRIYYAFAPGIALLGTAMTFSQLDPAGNTFQA